MKKIATTYLKAESKTFEPAKPSEKLLKIKDDILKHVSNPNFDTENFELDEELIEFATEMSKALKNLTEQTYYSKNKTYQIEVFETLYDFKHKGLKTPARVGQTSGSIQLQKSKLISDYTEDFVYHLIIWCAIEFCVLNLKQSDIISTKHYLTTLRSKQNLLKGYITLLELNPGEQNTERFTIVKKLVQD
jgi:hypothetical protein